MTRDDFFEIIAAVRRSLVRAPGQFLSPDSGLDLKRIYECIKFKVANYRLNPYFFKPCGTLVFCGSQGEGKTLTGVNYIRKILSTYPKCILVSNTKIKGRPFNAYIRHKKYTDTEFEKLYKLVFEERREAFYKDAIEEIRDDFYEIEYPTFTLQEYVNAQLPFYYFDVSDDKEMYRQSLEYELHDILTDELITPESILSGKHSKVTVQYTGLDCLKYINNGKSGVLFFIDEIHLELNSLESKNVPVEVMVEISQQRKQRKHIVGTAQRYNRLAKPLREQVRDIVACKCYLGVIQYNQLIDGDSTHEVNGELAYDVRRRMLWFHSPDIYKSYDTYAKMKRYNNEWHGRPQMVNYGGSINNE